MKKISFILGLLLPLMGQAQEKSMNLDELRSRVQMKVESFLTSSDGMQILDTGSNVSVYSGLDVVKSGFYKAQFKDLKEPSLSFKFSLGEDKTLKLEVIEYERMQYDSQSREPKFSGEVRRQTFAIKDFSSVSWVTKASADKNIVIRFLPQISDDQPRKLTYLPLAFSDAVITDNSGRLWGEGYGVTGEAGGFISAFGTFFISYSEFAGSKEIGVAKDDIITLKLTEKMTVKIRSSKSVVGPGYVAKLFGIFLPDKKGKPTIMGLSLENVVKQLKPTNSK